MIKFHSPKIKFTDAALYGIWGFATIYLIGFLSEQTSLPILIASFGSSCVIVFALHGTPAAQPVNVVGSYLVCGVIGVAVAQFLPPIDFAYALAVGLAIVAMMYLRVVHPPAAGVPILALSQPHTPDFTYIMPIIAGAVLIVGIAEIYKKTHRK